MEELASIKASLEALATKCASLQSRFEELKHSTEGNHVDTKLVSATGSGSGDTIPHSLLEAKSSEASKTYANNFAEVEKRDTPTHDNSCTFLKASSSSDAALVSSSSEPETAETLNSIVALESVLNLVHEDIMGLLCKLTTFQVNRQILASTKIGVVVGKLRSHCKTTISEQAQKLVDSWKSSINSAPQVSANSTMNDANKSAQEALLNHSSEAANKRIKTLPNSSLPNNSSIVLQVQGSYKQQASSLRMDGVQGGKKAELPPNLSPAYLKQEQARRSASTVGMEVHEQAAIIASKATPQATSSTSTLPVKLTLDRIHQKYTGPMSGNEARDRTRLMLFACFALRIFGPIAGGPGSHNGKFLSNDTKSDFLLEKNMLNFSQPSPNVPDGLAASLDATAENSTCLPQEEAASPPSKIDTLVDSASQLSARLEELLFREYFIAKRDQKAYKNQLKSIQWNLRDSKNVEFYQKLLFGVISPEKAAFMTSSEMASSEKKDERKRLRQEALEACQSDWERRNITIKDGQFTCFKCKGSKTSFTQAQIRSADEPMTTFVTCFDCGNRWKF